MSATINGESKRIWKVGQMLMPAKSKSSSVSWESAIESHIDVADYFGGCPSLTIPGFTHPVKDQ